MTVSLEDSVATERATGSDVQTTHIFRWKGARVVCIALVSAALFACAGVGIPHTSDPYEKLHWASGSIHVGGRPFPAQDLIREAYAIFRERGDELGIAAVDRVFAGFLASPVLAQPFYADWFTKRGFWDKTTRYEDRYPRAIEYHQQALEIYERHGRTDSITYVYLNVAEVHLTFGNQTAACAALLESERQYHVTKSFGDDINVVADLMKLLEDLRRRAQCH
jgi:hypothetical protein